MCRIEERIYISADGHRSKFEDTYACEKASRGKLCSKVKTRTTEYYPKKGSLARDETPSPLNPPTPTGPSTYLVQQRRPSSSGSRPSTREGAKQVPAEIHINIGSKKDKPKKYPSILVTSKPSHKRTSHGSTGSGDLILDSPGSDASATIRTGFPESPLPPSTFSHPESYIPTPTMSKHHRHTGSSGSSRTPSLYVTSDPDRDYDSPVTSRTAKYPTTIVHNPPAAASPSPSRDKTYRTSVVAPKFADETNTADGLFPLDYAEFADRSASSHASSAGPENLRKGKDEKRRKKEERARQEEMDRRVAEELARTDNVKQVRFELDRADLRAKERAENELAEKEKLRAEIREETRRQKQEEREKKDREEKVREKQDRDSRALEKRKKEKSQPPVSYREPRPTTGRRNSLTQAQIAEQQRLLAAEQMHIEYERKTADAREREEQMAIFKQVQETSAYYDPRGGDRSLSGVQNSLVRRGSVSRGNSGSVVAPTAGLTRTGSNRRASIVQPNPPALITPTQQTYSTRPPSARQHNPPPVSYPAKFNQGYERPPSARRPSITSDQPFGMALNRSSVTSPTENPFSSNPSMSSSSTVSHDPWDLRNVEAALPRDDRYAAHSRAQQATRAMGHASSAYTSVFDDDSDSPDYQPRGTSGRTKR